MLNITKEILEIPRRKLLRACLGHPDHKIKKVVESLKTQGFWIFEKYWDSNKVLMARQEIDKLCDSHNVPNSWTDAEKSDHRFFRAENHHPIFAEFLHDPFIEKVRKYYTGREKADKFVLAAKLLSKANNKGSGGGWHMDSPFSLQFKAFLFLSDVKEQNGPLQVIPETRRNLTRLKLEIQGLKKPGQYRFSNEEGEEISLRCKGIKSFTLPAGSLVLANVSALHRGKPIQNGERYALTLYCGDPRITEKLV